MKKRDYEKKGYDKRVIHIVRPYDTKAFEEYLNTMAQKGYLLLEVNEYQLFFKKEEKKGIRYSIGFLTDKDEERQYQEYCKSVGWEFACATEYLQIFHTTDPSIPAIETEDQIKFDVLSKFRKKRLIYLCLQLLCIFGIFAYVTCLNQMVQLSLSTIGLCIYGLGILWLMYVVSGIIEGISWTKRCKKKLLLNEPLMFGSSKIKCQMDRASRVGMGIFLGIMSVISSYRLILSWKENGLGHDGIFLPLMLVVYILCAVINQRLRGNSNRRGSGVSIVYYTGILYVTFVISTVVFQRIGGGDTTFLPEDFKIRYHNDQTFKQAVKEKSFLGSKEYGRVDCNNSELDDLTYYKYFSYESKFPMLLKGIQEEVMRDQGLTNHLTYYGKERGYKIHLAKLEKKGTDNLRIQDFSMNLVYYDGGILIEGKGKLFLFYYLEFDQITVEDTIKVLVSKL